MSYNAYRNQVSYCSRELRDEQLKKLRKLFGVMICKPPRLRDKGHEGDENIVINMMNAIEPVWAGSGFQDGKGNTVFYPLSKEAKRLANYLWKKYNGGIK